MIMVSDHDTRGQVSVLVNADTGDGLDLHGPRCCQKPCRGLRSMFPLTVKAREAKDSIIFKGLKTESFTMFQSSSQYMGNTTITS